MSQYALPLKLPAVYVEDNFVLSACNQQAWQQITAWPAWQSLLLAGPAGSGKTHLGHIWASRAKAMMIDCTHPLVPEEITTHCLLEHVETADEETLLHAINYARERDFSLLLTSPLPARQLSFTLPDLTSRLIAMPFAIIDAPDDEALAGVLRKQFSDRQIKVPEEIITFLVNHGERSFSAMQLLVSRLDAYMLENKKNITIPLVKRILQN